MKQINSKCSLCISTYNWPAALYHCLLSVKNQMILPKEVVVADDGSTDETALLLEEIKKDFPIPIIHVWHKDEGFRLAAIRNKSFAKASGDYIIQSDADVIFHPNFIKDHLRFAKKNTFVAGARCLLNKDFSEQLLPQPTNPTVAQMLQHCTKKHNGLHQPILSYANYLWQRGVAQTKYVLGVNMAFFKEDILAVNGYNEEFTGWGKEDNDIAVRLFMKGIKIRFIKFGAILYHIHHKGADGKQLEVNHLLYKKTLANKITFAPKGINQYI
jgi:glycosyltransferase involved in cell wall biosynthesis